MKLLTTLLVCLAPAWAQLPGLHGVVTDPSGAAVPGALVQLRGPGGERSLRTGNSGQYSISPLPTGKYELNVTAKGFVRAERKNLAISGPVVFDIQLVIQGEKQAVNVEDGTGRIGTDPISNRGAIVLGERQIAALSDDPDELALQLQALAGPAPGPDGGQIFIDGFTGGNLPPKSSIREVRINSNPFSPEYDRPGFGRIEIFTKPGSDSIRGQAFAQYNNDALNSRNPLLTESTRPPYSAQLFGINLSGPLKRNKASFTVDLEHRQIDENAFILATTLDRNLNPVAINQALATPQSRTTVTPRIDYSFNPRNTLVARYQEVRIGLDNQGVGDFSLASQAYNERQTERAVQLTETSAFSQRAVNETRFQYLRSMGTAIGLDSTPAIVVQGAFAGGGATVGNSGITTNTWELTNTSFYTLGKHTFKWGARVRQSWIADTSRRNFAGTFTFYTLDQYRSSSPAQFTLSAGTPTTRVQQTDLGLFVNDDWRVRPNLTFSFGLRYEAQTNLGNRAGLAPRLGIAWGLDGRAGRPAKTVLRAGAGVFFDRLPLALTLNRLRYDGVTQQSYTILNPPFFLETPSLASLQATQQPQFLRPVASSIQAPLLYQTSIGIERQLNQASRVALSWISSRGVHLLNSRNINAPISGVYPMGNRSIDLLTESAGLSRLNQAVANVNVSSRKVYVFGFYALSYGADNNEGPPANPYDLRAEWGPSTYGDVRHRGALGTTIPLAGKFSVSPFLTGNTGVPYNITTGLDPNLTGFPAERPALLLGAGRRGAACFNLNPAPGVATIGRNFGRGPAAVNLVLRVARTWTFGHEGTSGPAESGSSHGGAMGGPPPGMFGAPSGRKYNVTLSASTLNALNHPNFAPPNGDLSSPYFGQYRSLGGLIVLAHGGAPSTYNRKIDLQLRFTF